eukprot:3023471-Prymnesium_polylepis.1
MGAASPSEGVGNQARSAGSTRGRTRACRRLQDAQYRRRHEQLRNTARRRASGVGVASALTATVDECAERLVAHIGRVHHEGRRARVHHEEGRL